MRLDKLLSHCGFGTRKEVKKLIQTGSITVNDQIMTKPGFIVDETQDDIRYLNEPINYQEFYYIMLNKPQGIVSAKTDNLYETVIDWVALDYGFVDLFPVGRLDLDTTGLLLLTNDGQLAHRLLSPKHQVGKDYRAKISGLVTQRDVDLFGKGLDLGDFITQPGDLRIIETDEENGETLIELTIFEGKFHQVKRMFEAVDKKVLELHRYRMGPIVLDNQLQLGEYRELNSAEMSLLKPYGIEI